MNKEETIAKAEKIGALTQPDEKMALWDLAMEYIPANGLAIEIGTWTGGSAVIIGEVCRQKQAHLICIDLFNGDVHGMGENQPAHASWLKMVMDNLKGLPIDYMAGDSTDIVHYLQDEIADFVFIDGNHAFPKVTQDIAGYLPKVKQGGVLLGHDYTNVYDVKKSVDDVLGEDKIRLIDSVWIYENR